MQRRLGYLVLSLMIGACSGDSAGPAAMDGSTPEPDGGAQQELPESTVFLTRGDDGVLGGMAVASAGEVHFYSEELEAYWNLTLSAEEEEGLTGVPLEVRLTVSDEREVTYTAVDPTGRFAPIFFGTQLADSGMLEVSVDSRDLAEMDEPFFTTDLMGPSPFDDLALVVSVGTLARITLMAIGTGAAMSVLKSFLEGACQTAAPLHTEACAWVGFAVDVAGIAIAPGFKLKFADWAASRGVEFVTDVLGFIAGKACDRLGVTLEAAVNREDAETAAMRTQFRRALTYYNHLLWRLGETPPEDAVRRDDLEESLQRMLPLLLTVGPAFRDSYVYVHHPAWLPSYADFGSGALHTAVDKYITERSGLPVGDNLRIIARHLALEQSEVTERVIRALDSDPGRAGIAAFADCTITVVESLLFRDPSAASEEESLLEVDPTGMLVELADLLVFDLQELHQDAFGEAAPTLDCLADENEPNGSWRSAHVRPLPGVVLGLGEVVGVDGMTLCGIGGMPVDEDWYAFPVAPINWRAEARVIGEAEDPDCSDCSYDADGRVCVDMYWYSQTNELAGVPPTMLRSACGALDEVWTVGPVGVRGTAGETFRQILLHVRSEDPASTVPARYNLRFTR